MYQIQHIPLAQIPQLAHTDRAYSAGSPALSDFYQHKVDISQFAEIIAQRQAQYQPAQRALLVEVLQGQYQGLNLYPAAAQSLQLLAQANTFVVTTAHQPLLFAGPLYSIFKIVATIKLAEELKAHYPNFHFVPMYWIGSEDHDFEELNHCHIFGKKISWNDEQGGAVGSYQTESLAQTIAELAQILGDKPEYQPVLQLLRDCYLQQPNFAKGSFALFNELFQSTPLLIIDQNDKKLKDSSLGIFEEDILNQSSERLINQTLEQLAAKGFKAQAQPRPINLFFLLPNRRERLVFENGFYKVLNTDIQIPAAEIKDFIRQHSAQLSPNVVLRPLMQEHILPNLAYVGGGGEIAYWLERKSQFAHFKIPFPMLVRRPSGLFIDKNSSEKISKIGFGLDFWFENQDVISKKYLAQLTNQDFSLQAEKEAVQAIYQQILAQFPKVANALQQAVQAQTTTALNQLGSLSEKITRESKRLESEQLQQIAKLKDKLFPNGGLQERVDNFIPYYAKYGQDFIRLLLDSFEPLAHRFYIFQEQG